MISWTQLEQYGLNISINVNLNVMFDQIEQTQFSLY